MDCAVCNNPRQAARCRVCGFDNDAPEARDPAAVVAAREAFRAGTLAPRVQITTLDKLRPWLGLALGFVIFVTWLKACNSPGWPLWH